jgi:transaldolase
MQIFLDSTDTKVIADLASTGLVDGVTTNPTLIAKAGRPMLEVIAEICDLVPGPISAEVAATTHEAMIAEGKKLAAIAPNVVVKIPLTRDGLIACAAFAERGHLDQRHPVLLADPGPAGRQGRRDLRLAVHRPPGRLRLRRHGPDPRHPRHLRQLRLRDRNPGRLGAQRRPRQGSRDHRRRRGDHPAGVFADLFKHPLTDKGLEQFLKDWASTGQSIL